MTPPSNLEGGTHRMRMRAPGARGRERDALHALLAIASAAQQERKLPGQPDQLASPAAGEAPASAPQPACPSALQRMAESVCAVTEASGAAIAVTRGTAMVCVASTGRSAIELGASIDLEQGLAGKCVRTGEVQDCPDAESDARVNQEACHQLGVRALVMVPVRRRRQPALGVLAVFSDQRAHFSPRHLRFLEFMAGLVLEAAELGRPEASPPPARPRRSRLTEALARARARSAPQPGIREDEPALQTLGSRLRTAATVSLLAVMAAAVAWM
ncbi:MAG TPA: GAF domain-containing protein, partial [Terriglobales bacterium]|nr:GAF domain-containing protein [Terriglobales bacterium]